MCAVACRCPALILCQLLAYPNHFVPPQKTVQLRLYGFTPYQRNRKYLNLHKRIVVAFSKKNHSAAAAQPAVLLAASALLRRLNKPAGCAAATPAQDSSPGTDQLREERATRKPKLSKRDAGVLMRR